MIGVRILAGSISRNCVGCGASFVVESNHPQQKYCSLRCRSEKSRRKYFIQPCPVCDAPFQQKAPAHRYCSVSCSNVARARQQKLSERAP